MQNMRANNTTGPNKKNNRKSELKLKLESIAEVLAKMKICDLSSQIKERSGSMF